MGEAAESVRVDASLKEVWDFYFDPERWPAWVDGFSEVLSSSGYPERGGTLRWRSTPAGRGEVTEEVLEHEPRRLHRVRFSDPESEGELETTFEISGEQVEVTQRMDYRVLHPGLLGPFTDILFVRRQVAASLARSLDRLKNELESSER
jgi:uncharacterized membrane protein